MREKHVPEFLVELARFSIDYSPFREYLANTLTITQFCEALKEEMLYQFECDKRRNIPEFL
jgi:hypothetical protein